MNKERIMSEETEVIVDRDQKSPVRWVQFLGGFLCRRDHGGRFFSPQSDEE